MSDPNITPSESPTAKRLRQQALDRKAIYMFPNWTGWKTLKLVLTGVGVAASAIAVNDAVPPSWRGIAAMAGAVDAAALTAVITLSGTAAGPTVTK